MLLLGAGGLGSGVLQSLAGLGVGHVTIVDTDVVEPKNLARADSDSCCHPCPAGEAFHR